MGLLIGSIVLGIVFIILGIAVGIYYKSQEDSNGGWATLLLVLIAPLILLFGAFTKVDANEVGIIYDDRYGVMEEVKLEGFQTKSIFEHITKISTAVKTVTFGVVDPAAEDEMSGMIYAQTRDSIYAAFIITISYRIESTNAGKFFKITNNADLETDKLSSIVQQALQSTTIKYDIYDLLAGELEVARIEFENELARLMLEEYFITLTMATFNDIDAGNQIEESIQLKAQALQQIEIAQANQQKAAIENATAIARATADATAVLIAAEASAEAQALLNSVTINAINTMYGGQFTDVADKLAFEAAILADPDAFYGYLTITQISEIVLKQIYFDTWDGVLPKVVDDASGLIVTLE